MPDPKRLPRGPIKATVRAQRGEKKNAGGRPSKLDGPDFWLILDRIIGVLGQGGTDALAARCLQIHPNTFGEWRVAGDAAFADLSDQARDELRHAVTQYFMPASQGGSKGPLVNFEGDRLAKLAGVIEQAEANWTIVTLQAANRDGMRKGGGRLALSMISRKFGPAVYPPAHMPIEVTPGTGGAVSADGAALRVKRVIIAVPANGFRPGEPSQDEDDAPTRKRPKKTAGTARPDMDTIRARVRAITTPKKGRKAG